MAVRAVRLRARCSTASPRYGRAAHRQHAGYLESLYEDDTQFNPSDYGVHLTRRPRGLPFWFSLAVHGTDAYAEAVERTLARHARRWRRRSARASELELLAEPELSVLVFRRRGWAPADYDALGDRPARVRRRRSCCPTTHEGETVARLALVNPRTTLDDLGSCSTR